MSKTTNQIGVAHLVARPMFVFFRRGIICTAVCAAMLAPVGGYAQPSDSDKESAAQLSSNNGGARYVEMDGGVAPAAPSANVLSDQLPIAGLGIVILAAIGFTRWMRNGPIEELEARGLSRKTTGRIYLGKRGFN